MFCVCVFCFPDTEAPFAESLTLVSSNARGPDLARAGDTTTLTFVPSEPLIEDDFQASLAGVDISSARLLRTLSSPDPDWVFQMEIITRPIRLSREMSVAMSAPGCSEQASMPSPAKRR